MFCNHDRTKIRRTNGAERSLIWDMYFAFEIKFVHSIITACAHSAAQAAHYHHSKDQIAWRQCQPCIAVLSLQADAGLHLVVYPAPRWQEDCGDFTRGCQSPHTHTPHERKLHALSGNLVTVALTDKSNTNVGMMETELNSVSVCCNLHFYIPWWYIFSIHLNPVNVSCVYFSWWKCALCISDDLERASTYHKCLYGDWVVQGTTVSVAPLTFTWLFSWLMYLHNKSLWCT